MIHMTRQEFDARAAARMAAAGKTSAEIKRELERAYPCCTEAAIAEINERGLSTTRYHIGQVADRVNVRKSSGCRIWTSEDIDRACVLLEESNTFNHAGHYAKESGTTVFKLREAQDEHARNLPGGISEFQRKVMADRGEPQHA